MRSRLLFCWRKLFDLQAKRSLTHWAAGTTSSIYGLLTGLCLPACSTRLQCARRMLRILPIASLCCRTLKRISPVTLVYGLDHLSIVGNPSSRGCHKHRENRKSLCGITQFIVRSPASNKRNMIPVFQAWMRCSLSCLLNF